TKPLLLVDGSSFLFRAYHAMPPLTNQQGEPTGAVYGVISMLRRLLERYQPSHICVVFDAKGKTFRNDIYAEYKANRPPMPDELRVQIQPIHDIVSALGFPKLVIEGVEADDVIGTLATQASVLKMECVIVTGDKDMAQLVNEHVSLLNTMTDTFTDRDGVIDKFAVKPKQIIDYLALMGDSSDNIPGVPKVGPKTAAKWLKLYGDLDGVISHADEIKGKVGENLRASLSFLPMSYQLATIVCDVDLAMAPPDLQMQAADIGRLRELYTEMDFTAWLSALGQTATAKTALSSETHTTPPAKPSAIASGTGSYETILTQAVLSRWIQKLKQAPYFAFDTETTSLDYMQAEIVGVSFAVTAGEAAYVPLAHDYENAPQQLDRDATLAALKPLLEDPKIAKLGQNLKYDMSVLAKYAINMQGISHDTMLESYVIDSTATRHDMDSLALKYLQHTTIHFEDVAGKGKNQKTFNQIEIEQAAPYAAEDADITLRLHQQLWPNLQAQAGLLEVYNNIEIPLIPVLSRIERCGVLIDHKMLAIQSRQLEKRMQELELQAHELAGEEFNLASPKQIQAIFFEKLALPVLRKTPKGQPSTAEPVLQELALDFPLPKVILDYRGIAKLKSTYTDKLPLQIDKDSGRVHTSYHQAVASTGRLSSTDPNLQNIPIKTEEGRRVRQAFIAAPGNLIVAADYSQIELRIMAHISGDSGLLQAFSEGKDIHRATAAEVFGISLEQVSTEERRKAKAINFGLIYGMSAFGLARQLGIGRKEAQAYVDLYFERYPGVKNFMHETQAKAHDVGYVETVFGRRLYLSEINHKSAQRRQYAERTAINAPMQGTAADIIKLAMIAVDQWICNSPIEVKMIMQVHDELVFEIPEADVDKSIPIIVANMCNVVQLQVPLLVDVGTGENWGQAH
ncbi:MAG: DNA polymerase I, partial [Thiohalomonadales bacterium]